MLCELLSVSLNADDQKVLILCLYGMKILQYFSRQVNAKLYTIFDYYYLFLNQLLYTF